jgi:hypothetical protein
LLVGYALKYGLINKTIDLFINSSQQTKSTNNQKTYTVADDEQSLIESQSVNPTRVRTGSGAVIEIRTLVQPSEALKYALEIRSGNIEGVDGFVVKPTTSHNPPSSSKSLNSQIFGAKTNFDNDSENSDDYSSDGDTCYSSDESFDQLTSETLDHFDSSSVSSSNNQETIEVPEVSLDYEISDSEEIDDENYNHSEDKRIYLNSLSDGYKSAKNELYTDSVYQYKYSTSPSRLASFRRREIYANKKECELFSKDRTQDDLTSASKVHISDKRLKDKLCRHPDFFGLIRSKSSSKTPEDHLFSTHTRCLKNGLYREHQESYDYYYSNQTAELLIIKNNHETGEQEIFSFWTISKMQRLELFNHNHVIKHWKLTEALQKKR